MNIYTFKEYDPIFAEVFLKEKTRLQDNIALEFVIEHIGSTSVLNLGGKGVIDMMVVVNADDMQAMKGNLISSGYLYSETGSAEDRHFFILDEQSRRYHLHLVEENSLYLREAMFFRKYLRNNVEEMKAYEDFKKQILKMSGMDNLRYRELKNPYIRKILDESM